MFDESPPNYHDAERKVFGLAPTTSVSVLAALALVAGLVLLVAGSMIAGVLVLAGGLLLAALFVEQALRRRESPLDRRAATVIDRSRGFTRFAGVCARVWTGAGGRVTRSRLELQRLGREKTRLQHALGVAAYAEDDDEVAALRAELRELDARIEECSADARTAVEDARRRTQREKLAVEQTQIHKPS